MVRRIIMEMRLLAYDAPADCKYNNTRYLTMAAVGQLDMYDGLISAAKLFADYSVGLYRSIATLHTVS